MKQIVTLLFAVLSFSCCGRYGEFDYFGLKSPGSSVQLFAPDIVSLKNSNDVSLAISPKGDEVFFSSGGDWPECKIMHLKKVDGQWGRPELASFSVDCFTTEPAFSPDGRFLYYSASKDSSDITQCCIWRVEKIGDQWENPTKVIDFEDPSVWEFHPSVTKDGTVYFCSWNARKNVGSIYKSTYSNGTYSGPEKVGIPFDAQSSITNPFIDPSGRYIIVSANQYNGKKDYDSYISHRGKDGSWSSPINMGDKVNTPGDDNSVDISPDGKFVFIYRQKDVYWTDSKGIVKNTTKCFRNSFAAKVNAKAGTTDHFK